MEGGLYRVNVHIVVKGDTLWKIARQYGISFEELKKVNAHLANPDYIVPGMKIFLPKGKQGGKLPDKQKQPLPLEKQKPHEKPVKPESSAPPVPPVPKSTPPTPKPEMKPAPKPEVKPMPKPPTPPVPKPTPPIPNPEKPESPSYETPPVPSEPLMQQYPMTHPMVIGIPCGWMPIYDADCYPHAYPMPPQQMPMPPQHHQPTPPMMSPQPMPPQWQMEPESSSKCLQDESPIMPGQGPGWSPNHCDSMKLKESPTHPIAPIESSSFDLAPPAYCPPEQGYIPQQMPQQGMGQPMQGIQAVQHPHLMHLCTSCGTQMSQTPYNGMPIMGMPPMYNHGNWQQDTPPMQWHPNQNPMGYK